MKRSAHFHDDAKQELNEAYAYYERAQKGLGKKFKVAVREAVLGITSMPEAHSKVWNDIRRVRVKGFKYYVIHYLVETARITVISVFHTSRDPRIRQTRL